jgi:hypothetical protein
MAKQLDIWTGDAGQEMEMLDHGNCVEISTSGGEMVLLTPDEALHVCRGLEIWIASKSELITN